MKKFLLDEMKKGWFVGAFAPTAFSTETCEVASKIYKQGDHEESHFHKISTEITLIVSGCTRMNGINYRTGDILVIEPGDKTDFLAIEDTVTCVVKVPSALGDKYLTKDNPL